MPSAIVLSPSVPKLPLCCPSGWRGVLLAEGMSCGSLALDPSVRLGSSLRSGTCGSQWVGWGCLLGARQWASSLAGPCWWG